MIRVGVQPPRTHFGNRGFTFLSITGFISTYSDERTEPSKPKVGLNQVQNLDVFFATRIFIEGFDEGAGGNRTHPID
jgi:hypothetical protein